MQISTITAALENWAPLSYQESYDNAGLIIGRGKVDFPIFTEIASAS